MYGDLGRAPNPEGDPRNKPTSRSDSPKRSSSETTEERARRFSPFQPLQPLSDSQAGPSRKRDRTPEEGGPDYDARPTKRIRQDEPPSPEFLSLIHKVPSTEIDKSLERLFPGLNPPHIDHADLPQASTSQAGAPSESHHEQAGPVENTQEHDLSTTYLIPKDNLPGLVDEIIKCKRDNTNFNSHRFLSGIGVTDPRYTTVMIANTDQQIWRDHLNSKDYLATDIDETRKEIWKYYKAFLSYRDTGMYRMS